LFQVKAFEMFVQAGLPIVDEDRVAAIKATLEAQFSSSRMAGFLGKVQRSKLRVRDFETLLARGMLGASTAEAYKALGDSDRGQVREFYLSLVEQTPQALRGRFLKVYAYY
jgi:hypothetical protein